MDYHINSLYSIPLIGVGSGRVESLTSFIIRLAYEHQITVGSLFQELIFPKIHKPYLNDTNHPNSKTTWKYLSSVVDNVNLRRNQYVQVISNLTGINNISLLTMQPWANLISNRGLIRKFLHWCPICLQDWLSTQQTIYYPLLWSITCINICEIHGVNLLSECSFCHEKLYNLWPFSRVGYCSFCHQWLGQTVAKKPISKVQPKNPNIFITSSIGKMLEITEEFHDQGLLDIKILSKGIQQIINRYFNGNLNLFAIHTNIGISTIRDWINSGSRIEISSILRILACFGLSIEQLIPELSDSVKLDISRKYISIPRKVNKMDFYAKDLEYKLISEIEKNELPPPSLLEISRRIKHDYRHLRKLFPSQCERILNRRKNYFISKKIKREFDDLQTLTITITALHDSNEPISMASLRSNLPRPGIMKNPKLREEFKKKNINISNSTE